MIRDKFRTLYQRMSGRDNEMRPRSGDDFQPEDSGLHDLEEAEYEGSIKESKAVLDRIYEEFDQTRDEYGMGVDTIVLGVEDYLAADAYLRAECDTSAEQRLPGNTVVVPGRMIYAPPPTEEIVWEELIDE